MAVAKKLPVEEIDPEHPQYQHGMEAGITATSALASLPRPTPGTLPRTPGPAATVGNEPTMQATGIGGLPRVAGPSPAVGGTQAVLPPKINPPKTLPRNRNQSAIEQPNPADFFRRK